MSEGNDNAGVSAKRSDGDRACCADMTPAAHRAPNLLLTHTHTHTCACTHHTRLNYRFEQVRIDINGQSTANLCFYDNDLFRQSRFNQNEIICSYN